MTHALLLTATNRHAYLAQVLKSWGRVRDLDKWRVVARIEPVEGWEKTYETLDLYRSITEHPNFDIFVNKRVLGVLDHPFVAMSELFLEHDFVVRTEDDLLLADDTLEYLTWAEQEYRRTERVATINGFSRFSGSDDAVYLLPRFNPWLWGTWRSVWETVLAPQWDHDYSTYNERPGNESGWDWNIDTRIFPRYGYEAVYPGNSRVQNIGLFGVHGTPDNIQIAKSFRPDYGPQDYVPIAR